jgi:hypothetical protein
MPSPTGDRGFESISLQRRVICEPDFLDLAQEPAAAALPVQLPLGRREYVHLQVALRPDHSGDLTVDDFARLVAESRVRFALIGDVSEGIRRIFGETRQKPLTDWIHANGKRVDGALWQSSVTPADTDAAGGCPRSPQERIGAQLYDLRPSDDDGG